MHRSRLSLPIDLASSTSDLARRFLMIMIGNGRRSAIQGSAGQAHAAMLIGFHCMLVPAVGISAHHGGAWWLLSAQLTPPATWK